MDTFWLRQMILLFMAATIATMLIKYIISYIKLKKEQKNNKEDTSK